MATFTNNNVASGDVVRASDHNSQGAAIAAVVNGNIDNSNINASAAIAGTKLADSAISTVKIADGAVTNAKLSTTAGELGGEWLAYTPTLTGITVGNGVLAASYTKVGKTVKVRVKFTFGTTSSSSGQFGIANPSTASAASAATVMCGVCYLENQSITGYMCMVRMQDVAKVVLIAGEAAGTYTQVVGVTNAVPFAWGTGDYFTATWEYEAD